MSVRHLLTDASVYAMSAGRIGALVASVLGLIGVVIGLLVLAGRSGPRGALIALTMGVIGIAVGALVVATSDSGIGTGNGRGGAYVALVVGLAAAILGGLALIRPRRTS